ncbi:ribonucleotide-diphosphate reductase subunit alpha [Endomicrobiia bacterium]|nr:ribonucleotide-diphosphate reductase subunit alpha [Endomicrobiia bacterium]GHT11293.1 ribonucleotide-diphosphate reductase subunit alpha [Endomicrobiia bacterium]GHT19553.1 ribonucleotide-diphosphate reductase subunit alpha [Endomicrobiia bacterium]GHT25628.1 ribonucleotide-diphosphate reductase subunit alpha [Endomicrobiia bacterium]GHT30536.1 ribonucleotide-diphosphate reductase subunit alpha [Endomicrobiia bacterium]
MLRDKKEELISENKVNLENNALTVLKKRYLKKDKDGNVIESPEDLFYRVAENIAQADKIYDEDTDTTILIREFYLTMSSCDFLPNSPTLMNAGRHLQQLSACFVLPIDDSMDSIFETLKNTALIHKSGGGTGFSFSRLRPKKDVVRTTSGISSGPISFMQVFNAATEAIKQGGTRRGANMGMLRIDHPDILDFIICKDKDDSLNNFNISVAITKKFMDALEKGEYYNLYNPRNGVIIGRLNANEVFGKIVDQAWKNGEPGIVFVDRMNHKNPTPSAGSIESTNPCGEQPLLPYESCNLGSINLGHFVKNNDVNWEKLEKTVKTAVHFLDNVIDVSNYPIQKIGEVTRSNRKIGLGIMGWADLLLYLGIPYGSNDSLALAEELMGFIHSKSRKASEELAFKRGSFPNFKKSIYAKGSPVRNATTTTIAPTGTIGMIASASSGIEPIFALVYKRMQCLDNEEMYEVNPYFEKLAKENGFYSPELIDKISEKGSIRGFKEIPEKIKKIFVTSHDIAPEEHIKMQAAFQKFTDNAVSKTVNFPNSATKEDVKKVYILSYKMGCKGVTVYRDGSRNVQVLNLANKKEEYSQGALHEKKPRTRPKKTTGLTFLMHTGCGKMYVTVNEDDRGMCEVFTQLGKSGGCTSSQAEAISRLISLALRSGVDQQGIIDQLKGIRCPSPTLADGGIILSCADAVAKALEAYKREKMTPVLSARDMSVSEPYASKYIKKHYTSGLSGNSSGACPQCPECGEMLTFAESCVICRGCSYSKCF